MKSVTAQEVQQQLENGENLNIIDVRETEEVAEGKIPGATNIPLGLLEFRLHELDKSKEYTMVCLSGGRSGRASELMEKNGFSIINMTGGMLAWDGPTE